MSFFYVFMSEGLHFLKWSKSPLPMHQETWNFVHSLFNVDVCHSWHSKSSRLHSIIKNVLQDSLVDALESQNEGPLPKHLDTWYFIHSFLNVKICHSWCSKSSRLHSGIKMSSETPWRMIWRHKKSVLFQCTKSVEILHTASWNPKSFTNKEYSIKIIRGRWEYTMC